MGFSPHSWAFILVSVFCLCPISPPFFLKHFQTHPIHSTPFIATPPIPQRKKANPSNTCHSLVLSNHSPFHKHLSFHKPSHPLTFCLSLTLLSIHLFLHPTTYLPSCPLCPLTLPSICLYTHLFTHLSILPSINRPIHSISLPTILSPIRPTIFPSTHSSSHLPPSILSPYHSFILHPVYSFIPLSSC